MATSEPGSFRSTTCATTTWPPLKPGRCDQTLQQFSNRDRSRVPLRTLASSSLAAFHASAPAPAPPAGCGAPPRRLPAPRRSHYL
jgi:hypothetical protein